MADLSAVSDEDLKKMYSASQTQSATPSTTSSSSPTDLTKVSDEDLKAMYASAQTYNTSNNETPKPSMIDSVTDPILAAGGGVAEGAANIANSIGGLMKEFIGYASPAARKWLDKGDQALSKHSSVVEDANGITQAKAEYPNVAEAGKGVGMAAGVLGAGGAIPGGAMAQATGQGILGAAMAGEGNRAAGFAGGMIVPALASSLTAPLGKYLSANATLPEKIKDLRSSINASKEYPNMNIHEATEASFSKFKQTPGEVSKVRPMGVVDDFLAQHEARLSPQQAQIMKETQEGLQQAKTLEDLHNVRKGLTNHLDTMFLKGDNAVVGKTRVDLMNVKAKLENNLQMNARKLGVLDKYEEANSLYKQSREANQINKAFDQTIQSTGTNDWTAFNNTFKKLRTGDDVKIGSGQTKAVMQAEKDLSYSTKQQIKGIQEVIKEASNLYGINHTNVRVGGVGVGNMVLESLKSLSNVPVGKQVLMYMGTPGGRALAKQLVQGLTNLGQAQYIKTASPPVDPSANQQEEVK